MTLATAAGYRRVDPFEKWRRMIDAWAIHRGRAFGLPEV